MSILQYLVRHYPLELVVLRNSSGHFLSAIAIPIQQQLGPKVAEVVRVREALSWVKQKNLTEVILETNSQLVFNAMKNTSMTISLFAMLITYCRILASSIAFLSFSFTKISANSATHVVARATSSLSSLVV